MKNRPKLIDKTIFECFNKLTCTNTEDRVKGASNLISYLEKNDDEEKVCKLTWFLIVDRNISTILKILGLEST